MPPFAAPSAGSPSRRSGYVANGLAYVSTADALRVLDVSDPAAPVQLGTFPVVHGSVNALEVVGSRLYIAERPFGVRILDVSDPRAPRLFGVVSPDPPPTGGPPDSQLSIAIEGDVAYLAENAGYFATIDVANPYARA